MCDVPGWGAHRSVAQPSSLSRDEGPFGLLVSAWYGCPKDGNRKEHGGDPCPSCWCALMRMFLGIIMFGRGDSRPDSRLALLVFLLEEQKADTWVST